MYYIHIGSDPYYFGKGLGHGYLRPFICQNNAYILLSYVLHGSCDSDSIM